MVVDSHREEEEEETNRDSFVTVCRSDMLEKKKKKKKKKNSESVCVCVTAAGELKNLLVAWKLAMEHSLH
jgi:hypothetical protein